MEGDTRFSLHVLLHGRIIQLNTLCFLFLPFTLRLVFGPAAHHCRLLLRFQRGNSDDLLCATCLAMHKTRRPFFRALPLACVCARACVRVFNAHNSNRLSVHRFMHLCMYKSLCMCCCVSVAYLYARGMYSTFNMISN